MTQLCCLPYPKVLQRGDTFKASHKKRALLNQGPNGKPRFFCERGARLARAIAGSLARDVDAPETREGRRETQTAAYFGIPVHEPSHHVDCVSANSWRFHKIVPALVSYRRA